MVATLRQSSVDPVVAANLRRALQQRGRTAYSVATALGRAPNWLYRVINGNAGILIPTLREVAAELGVAAGSLLEPPQATHVGALEGELPYAAVLRPGYRPVQLVTSGTVGGGSAGDADHAHVAGYLPFREDWLAKHRLNPSRCSVIEVVGQSMEPSIQHRAVILVDHQRTQRRHDRIFVLGSEEGELVKRAWRTRDGWQMMSDNPDKDRYPTVPWPAEASVRGQVIWTGKTL